MGEEKLKNDWLSAVDKLAQCIVTLRAQCSHELAKPEKIENLRVSTYLYQIDRLLVKIREYYFILRVKQEQFTQRSSVDKMGFEQAQQACVQCFRTTVNLQWLLAHYSNQFNKLFFSEKLIAQIHMLELQTTTLCSTLRMLDQLAYQHEEAELSQLEQHLIQALLNPVNFQVERAQPPLLRCEVLQLKINNIANLQNKALIEKIILGFDALKKCYVISRKLIINDTLAAMLEAVEALINEFLQSTPVPDKIVVYLQHFFQQMESLLFSAHRVDSRCSLNLFNKTKEVRRNLRKACLKHPIGYEYIQQCSMPKTLGN